MPASDSKYAIYGVLSGSESTFASVTAQRKALRTVSASCVSEDTFDFSIYLINTGTIMATRIAAMAITMINSIKDSSRITYAYGAFIQIGLTAGLIALVAIDQWVIKN
jgi:hypothetical protein